LKQLSLGYTNMSKRGLDDVDGARAEIPVIFKSHKVESKNEERSIVKPEKIHWCVGFHPSPFRKVKLVTRCSGVNAEIHVSGERFVNCEAVSTALLNNTTGETLEFLMGGTNPHPHDILFTMEYLLWETMGTSSGNRVRTYRRVFNPAMYVLLLYFGYDKKKLDLFGARVGQGDDDYQKYPRSRVTRHIEALVVIKDKIPPEAYHRAWVKIIGWVSQNKDKTEELYKTLRVEGRKEAFVQLLSWP
jgi:hypothetical protein